MRHFNGVYTVCTDKNKSVRQKYIIILKYKMGISKLILSKLIGKSIRMKYDENGGRNFFVIHVSFFVWDSSNSVSSKMHSNSLSTYKYHSYVSSQSEFSDLKLFTSVMCLLLFIFSSFSFALRLSTSAFGRYCVTVSS